MKWLALLLLLACTRTNPDVPVDRCVAQASCGTGVYSLCAENGCNTRYSVGQISFKCSTCTDCQSALSQVTLFCAGGGSDASCATMPTGSACIDCCVSHHSPGYDHYLSLLANCECVSPASCSAECAASFCLDHTQTDTLCNTCITANSGSGGVCDITPACQFDADCTALLQCATPCPQ